MDFPKKKAIKENGEEEKVEKYVTEMQFASFVNNHFAHVAHQVDAVSTKVEKLSSVVNFLRGEITIMLPVLILILGLVIALVKGT